MEYEHKCTSTIAVVISGSFRKHLVEIIELKKLLEEEKIAVLSPNANYAIDPDEEFIILDSDPLDNPEILQQSVFAKIRRSTFLLVANFNGYLGNAAVLEIGYALGAGIPIYTLEPVKDPNIKPFCKSLESVYPHLTKKVFNLI